MLINQQAMRRGCSHHLIIFKYLLILLICNLDLYICYLYGGKISDNKM